MDDSGKPKSAVAAQTPLKIKAEDNPWYLLATLYGVLTAGDDNLKAKNRIAWNRYFAANLDEEARTKLIEEKRHPAEELTLFSPDELQEVATAFAERSKASPKKLALPACNANIDFSNVDFERDAFLSRCLFSGEAYFKGATFSGGADFDGATFSGQAAFVRASFSRWSDFDGATFSGEAGFEDATFSGEASFHTATFGEKSSFVNAEMKGETSFKGAIFKTEPPKFFGAKLHQGTVWRGITWPPKPKDNKEAGAFIDAYACLKLEMDRLKKHDDELDFFALELQSRRIEQGPVWGFPFAIYGVLSGYGRSYLRPLGALF